MHDVGRVVPETMVLVRVNDGELPDLAGGAGSTSPGLLLRISAHSGLSLPWQLTGVVASACRAREFAECFVHMVSCCVEDVECGSGVQPQLGQCMEVRSLEEQICDVLVVAEREKPFENWHDDLWVMESGQGLGGGDDWVRGSPQGKLHSLALQASYDLQRRKQIVESCRDRMSAFGASCGSAMRNGTLDLLTGRTHRALNS